MLLPGEIVVDSFAGGGGASEGIERAIGRPVDVAINHDADAIAMHAANHPHTRHFTEDVFRLNPRAVTGGRPVGLLWASPDCRHFSRARAQGFPDGYVLTGTNTSQVARIGNSVPPALAEAVARANLADVPVGV